MKNKILCFGLVLISLPQCADVMQKSRYLESSDIDDCSSSVSNTETSDETDMQSPQEPNFYLKHGFDKEYTDYGCPYMCESCDVNKPSDNLIVYGHHMKNGTMFSDLEKFKSKDFGRNTRPSALKLFI